MAVPRPLVRKNIFILYIPPSNPEAMQHFLDTVERGVPLGEIAEYLPDSLRERLGHLFSTRPLTIWGSRNTRNNRSKFESMRPGDDIIVVVGGQIRLLGFVAEKIVNSSLSRRLWTNLLGGSNAGWDLIYFIANPVEITIPWEAFCQLIGYRENFQLRGFTRVSEDRLDRFYRRYDSFYEVLLRIDRGEQPRELKEVPVPVGPRTADEREEYDSLQAGPTKHDEIQWKLSKLGLKTGSKIWVPRSDQGRISRAYEFNEFEPEFSSGLDVPTRYVENIDVVWKDEYRIDAAFEVEHSTSIYSGLLRFSDLKIVAPNSTYPLFIVAESDRRQRLKDQLARPTFQKSNIRGAVRFLPYDTIERLWQDYGQNGHSLTVDQVASESEDLAV